MTRSVPTACGNTPDAAWSAGARQGGPSPPLLIRCSRLCPDCRHCHRLVIWPCRPTDPVGPIEDDVRFVMAGHSHRYLPLMPSLTSTGNPCGNRNPPQMRSRDAASRTTCRAARWCVTGSVVTAWITSSVASSRSGSRPGPKRLEINRRPAASEQKTHHAIAHHHRPKRARANAVDHQLPQLRQSLRNDLRPTPLAHGSARETEPHRRPSAARMIPPHLPHTLRPDSPPAPR